MHKTLIPLLNDIPNLNIKINEPMSAHTTFKIGGPAKLFLEASSIDAVISAVDILNNADIKPLILGNGSNLLVSDCGYDGVVLKIMCSEISLDGNSVYAEAGALLSSVASFAQKHSLTGLEFAHGIPGTVGGAVVMNAGAYGGEISDILIESTYIHKGNVFTITNDMHDFAYRNSIYKHNPEYTILSAKFALLPGDKSDISARMRELAEKRRDKQPLEYPSAGSTFKRPEGYFAAALIEQCNLKGVSFGGAVVSQKHSGFIINQGNATADDVKKLIAHIQKTVFKETGVSLECEICFV